MKSLEQEANELIEEFREEIGADTKLRILVKLMPILERQIGELNDSLELRSEQLQILERQIIGLKRLAGT
jgi:hypothetical protein